MTANEFMSATVDYWQGYFELFEDLPDGAWWASIEDTLNDASELQACSDALDIGEIPKCDGHTLARAYLSALEAEDEGN